MAWRLRATILFLSVSVACTVTLRAEIPGFPQEGLQDRVEFWEKVFTIYGADDLIFHDRERVDLIYMVVKEASRRTGDRQVRALLSEVRNKLSTPEDLSPEARRLYDAIEADGVRMTPGDIAVLGGRIHVQRGVRERFRDGVVRSGRYLPHFEEVFRSEGVPTVLTLLPLVESSFENGVRSHAGAAGIWQFMPATGRLFMTVNRGRDDRLNPSLATRAAARLLKGNYDALKSWPLAITAYNHGRSGMVRAKAAHGPNMAAIIRNYESRSWGYASKNFYAEFLAAVNVYNDYDVYFGPLALDQPLDFSPPAARMASRTTPANTAGATHRVRSGETLGTIARRYNATIQEIMDLNALPSDLIIAGETLVVTGLAAETGPDGRYQVRFGDTLSEIAHDFGVGIQDLMRLNGLESSRIYAGQVLLVR